MGSSTTTTKGARRPTKESGTHAIRECVEASNGQRAAIYLRRSAMDERGDSRSIDYQREACEHIAAQHGLDIVGEFDEGSGRSASHFKENERPEYDRALEGLGSS